MSDDVSRTSTDENASRADTTAGGDGGDAGHPPTIESVSEPAVLTDRDDVEHFERTYPHDDADYCEADAAGRVIVGVTNDAGEVLMLVYEEADHVVFPNCTVDSDEDWAAVARRTVEEATGVTVEIAAPERVRVIEHVLEEDDEPLGTSHHVVVSASPVAGENDGDEPSAPDDVGCEAGWHDEVPVPVDPDQTVATADAIDDVRLFLE